MSKWAILRNLPLWNISVIIFLVFLAILYLWILGPFQRNHCSTRKACLSNQAMFLAGIFILIVAWASPLFFFAHILLSIHMIQMSLLYFIAPPLLISGIPDWLLRTFDLPMNRWRWLRWLSQPFAAMLIFNGLFILYHVPAVFDVVMTQSFIHSWFFEVLLFFALMLWRPLVSPISEHQLQGIQRRRYVSANSWLLMPACFYLLIPSSALFQTYNNPQVQFQALRVFMGPDFHLSSLPSFFHLSAATDQKWGSLFMIGFHYLSFGWFKK